MKGIVIASHGTLAAGMADTLKIFADEQPQLEAICLLPGDDTEEFKAKMEKAIDEVDSGEGVVLFCDLLFGTPCNMAGRILNEDEYKERVTVITGMNLPMILEFVGMRQASDMSAEDLITTGSEGIKDFGAMLKARRTKQ